MLLLEEGPTCDPGPGLNGRAGAGAQEPSGPSVRATFPVAVQSWAVWENAVVRRQLFIALQKSKTNVPAQTRSCYGLLFCGFC